MGVETALIAGAIASAGSSMYAARKNAKAQKEAQAANEKIASEQAAAMEAQANAAEQLAKTQVARQPAKSPLPATSRAAAREGLSSTMLTGAGGVDPGMLSLGRQTLLGRL